MIDLEWDLIFSEPESSRPAIKFCGSSQTHLSPTAIGKLNFQGRQDVFLR